MTTDLKLIGSRKTRLLAVNIPSWPPDSQQIAFVSYMLVPGEIAGDGE